MPDYEKMYTILRDAIDDVIAIVQVFPQTRAQGERLWRALRQAEGMQTEFEEAKKRSTP